MVATAPTRGEFKRWVRKAQNLRRRRDTETPANTPAPAQVFGAPHVRKGESVLTSRGYQISRIVKAQLDQLRGQADAWSHAKVEMEVHQEFKAAYGAGVGAQGQFDGGTLAPFGSEFLPDEMGKDTGFGARVKSLMYAGVQDADPEEMQWLAKRLGRLPMGMKTATAQSWLEQTYGGALVGPPQYGELITLWRNQEALARAGATISPMPPNGRFVAPRQTNVTSAAFVGEGVAGTASNVRTGQIVWSAKKLMSLLVYTREFLQFAGPASELLLRMDLTRSMALGADQAFLEGVGSDTKPYGLINNPNIAVVTPSTAASGNTGAILAPGDIYSFNAAVEENNIPDDMGCAFVGRPALYWALLKRRADAAVASDAKGTFMFSPFRALGDAMGQKNINGQRYVATTQVSQSRVQGTTTNLTYLMYGYWPDYLIFMSPMTEFIVANQGDPAGLGDLFSRDLFCLKSILFCDGNARHPGGFAWADKLQIA